MVGNFILVPTECQRFWLPTFTCVQYNILYTLYNVVNLYFGEHEPTSVYYLITHFHQCNSIQQIFCYVMLRMYSLVILYLNVSTLFPLNLFRYLTCRICLYTFVYSHYHLIVLLYFYQLNTVQKCRIAISMVISLVLCASWLHIYIYNYFFNLCIITLSWL